MKNLRCVFFEIMIAFGAIVHLKSLDCLLPVDPYLAREYRYKTSSSRITGASKQDICKHNEMVAYNSERAELKQIWSLVRTFIPLLQMSKGVSGLPPLVAFGIRHMFLLF